MTGAEIARHLGGRLVGASRPVTALVPPDRPRPDGVVVASDAAQLTRLGDAEVAAVVLPEALLERAGSGARPVIVVSRPRLALAQLSALFDARPRPSGRHPSAVVASDARLGHGVVLGAGAVIEAGAVIGDGCVIGPGSVVGAGARLGAGCTLHARVVCYDGVQLGRRVTVHAGAVIGSDGFGYAPGPRGAAKIHHLGGVEIGDEVEIGANAVINRGTLDATRVGARTKIDAHCLIAHNVQIGSDCLLAGKTGVAGSCRIGDRVIMGGSVLLADHVAIGDGARLAGGSGVSKDVPAGETWAGVPARPYRSWVRGLYLQGQLETIWAFVRRARKAWPDPTPDERSPEGAGEQAGAQAGAGAPDAERE